MVETINAYVKYKYSLKSICLFVDVENGTFDRSEIGWMEIPCKFRDDFTPKIDITRNRMYASVCVCVGRGQYAVKS